MIRRDVWQQVYMHIKMKMRPVRLRVLGINSNTEKDFVNALIKFGILLVDLFLVGERRGR